MMSLTSIMPIAAVRGAVMASTRSVTYVPWLSTDLLFDSPKNLTALDEEVQDVTTKRFVERGALFSAPCLDPQVRQMVAMTAPTSTETTTVLTLQSRTNVAIMFSSAQGEGGGNLTRRQGYYGAKLGRPVRSV